MIPPTLVAKIHLQGIFQEGTEKVSPSPEANILWPEAQKLSASVSHHVNEVNTEREAKLTEKKGERETHKEWILEAAELLIPSVPGAIYLTIQLSFEFVPYFLLLNVSLFSKLVWYVALPLTALGDLIAFQDVRDVCVWRREGLYPARAHSSVRKMSRCAGNCNAQLR